MGRRESFINHPSKIILEIYLPKNHLYSKSYERFGNRYTISLTSDSTVHIMAFLEEVKIAKSHSWKLSECCSHSFSTVCQVNRFPWPLTNEGLLIVKIKDVFHWHDL